MWDVEHEVVVIVAMSGIIPPNQALINIVDITGQERERLRDQFDLWDVCKNIWVGTEINMLRGTVRLSHKEHDGSDFALKLHQP
jgi:hypothetical protein